MPRKGVKHVSFRDMGKKANEAPLFSPHKRGTLYRSDKAAAYSAGGGHHHHHHEGGGGGGGRLVRKRPKRQGHFSQSEIDNSLTCLLKHCPEYPKGKEFAKILKRECLPLRSNSSIESFLKGRFASAVKQIIRRRPELLKTNEHRFTIERLFDQKARNRTPTPPASVVRMRRRREKVCCSSSSGSSQWDDGGGRVGAAALLDSTHTGPLMAIAGPSCSSSGTEEEEDLDVDVCGDGGSGCVAAAMGASLDPSITTTTTPPRGDYSALFQHPALHRRRAQRIRRPEHPVAVLPFGRPAGQDHLGGTAGCGLGASPTSSRLDVETESLQMGNGRPSSPFSLLTYPKLDIRYGRRTTNTGSGSDSGIGLGDGDCGTRSSSTSSVEDNNTIQKAPPCPTSRLGELLQRPIEKKEDEAIRVDSNRRWPRPTLSVAEDAVIASGGVNTLRSSSSSSSPSEDDGKRYSVSAAGGMGSPILSTRKPLAGSSDRRPRSGRIQPISPIPRLGDAINAVEMSRLLDEEENMGGSAPVIADASVAIPLGWRQDASMQQQQPWWHVSPKKLDTATSVSTPRCPCPSPNESDILLPEEICLDTTPSSLEAAAGSTRSGSSSSSSSFSDGAGGGGGRSSTSSSSSLLELSTVAFAVDIEKRAADSSSCSTMRGGVGLLPDEEGVCAPSCSGLVAVLKRASEEASSEAAERSSLSSTTSSLSIGFSSDEEDYACPLSAVQQNTLDRYFVPLRRKTRTGLMVVHSVPGLSKNFQENLHITEKSTRADRQRQNDDPMTSAKLREELHRVQGERAVVGVPPTAGEAESSFPPVTESPYFVAGAQSPVRGNSLDARESALLPQSPNDDVMGAPFLSKSQENLFLLDFDAVCENFQNDN